MTLKNQIKAGTLQPHQEEMKEKALLTKSEALKKYLFDYGFNQLEKVKELSSQNQTLLINMLSEKGLPYAIAMFDYLKFISFLNKEYFETNDKRNKEISKWFDKDKDGRAVKGNISSLLPNTTENKNRYTAHKHKESVIKDYELLK
jgi:Glu-tRNA(Gln) amidotransferase subunit E-like FAD-binding protein